MKNKLRKIKHFILFCLYYIPMMFYKKNSYNIISDEKTVDKIVDEKYSLCRYGDGEIKWMLGIKQKSFQNDNDDLRRKLLEILCEPNNSKVLIAIPLALNNLNDLTISASSYWMRFIVKYHKRWESIISKEKEYSNTNITRPYMDYKNKNHNIMKNKFENLKCIWNDRNVIIVEGKYSRLGVTNDLFKNTKSIKRIICPSFNAFDKYNEICLSILNNYSKNDLILISLGPTATIISYELSKKNIQCIDIGHIDVEYEWFLEGSKDKTSISGKFVNEAQNKQKIEDVEDEKYYKQIIDTIGE